MTTPPDAGRVEEIVNSGKDAIAVLFREGFHGCAAIVSDLIDVLTTHAETIRRLTEERDELQADVRVAKICDAANQQTIRRLDASNNQYLSMIGKQDARIAADQETIRRLEGEVAEYEAIAELMRRRESPWIKRWQEATGKHDTLPDYGEMLTWIVQRADAAEGWLRQHGRHPMICGVFGDYACSCGLARFLTSNSATGEGA